MDKWIKSSYSQGNGGDCLECRTATGRVVIRDTQNRDLGHLSMPVAEWRAFLAAVRNREL